QPAERPAPDARQRALLDRYVRAWEEADLDGFVALLREDAVVSMPPWPHRYRGPEAIGAFFTWVRGLHGPGPDTYTFVPTAANRQPAFAVYLHGRPHAIQVLTIREGEIAAVVAFRDARLFARFGLPAELPAPAR